MGNNFWTPILGDIDPIYNLFAFDIGIWNTSTVTFTIFTDVTTYTYANQTVPNFPSMAFWGFYSPDEILTGFRIDGDAGPGLSLPGITNVRVGSTDRIVQVPEPGSVALFGAGLLGIGFVYRRRSAAWLVHTRVE